MASIFSQGGYLYINVMIPNEETGKLKRKKISTGLKDSIANRKIAEKKYLKEVEDGIRSGVVKIPKVLPTFKKLADEYFKKKRDEGLRKYVVDFYKGSLEKHVSPIFNEIVISEITANDIDLLEIELKKIMKLKTLKNLRVPFKGIFDLAFKKNLIASNPFDKVNKLSEDTGKTIEQNKKLEEKLDSDTFESDFDKHKLEAADPFEEAEILQLIESAEGQMKNLSALIYLLGGMRPSEIIALTWRHVDFEKRILYVLGSVTGYQTKDESHLTKTQSSFRKVYISEAAMKYLKEQYVETGEKGREIFLTKKGEAYKNSKSLNEQFQNVLEKAKMKKRFLYNLRHSYASINLSQERLPLLFVSEQMGHKDASVTLQKYARYVNKHTETTEMINNAFRAFNRLLA
jgi:integrase